MTTINTNLTPFLNGIESVLLIAPRDLLTHSTLTFPEDCAVARMPLPRSQWAESAIAAEVEFTIFLGESLTIPADGRAGGDQSATVGLSAIRDRCFTPLLVGIAQSDARQDAAVSRTLRSLGFRALPPREAVNWYLYDIHNYKDTPDWLSPAHWANPDQWDKKRW